MVSFDPAAAKLGFIHLDQNVQKKKKEKAKLYIHLVSVHKWQSKNVIAVSRLLAQLTINENLTIILLLYRCKD